MLHISSSGTFLPQPAVKHDLFYSHHFLATLSSFWLSEQFPCKLFFWFPSAPSIQISMHPRNCVDYIDFLPARLISHVLRLLLWIRRVDLVLFLSSLFFWVVVGLKFLMAQWTEEGNFYLIDEIGVLKRVFWVYCQGERTMSGVLKGKVGGDRDVDAWTWSDGH